MLNWIANNKEWLFSGVGIFVFLAVIGILKWFHRRRSQVGSLGNKSLQAVIDAPASPVPVPVKLSSSLSPEQIKAAFKDAPILQQAEIQRQFKGIQVSWPAILADAEKKKDGTIRLMLNAGQAGGSYFAFCYVKPEQHPGLGLLRSGHRIDVSGTIDTVERNHLELEQVTIRFELPGAS